MQQAASDLTRTRDFTGEFDYRLESPPYVARVELESLLPATPKMNSPHDQAQGMLHGSKADRPTKIAKQASAGEPDLGADPDTLDPGGTWGGAGSGMSA